MFEPTDEQIEALAKADAFINGATEHEWDSGTGAGANLWIADARTLTQSPAFQAIIRAAQAAAWEEGHEDGCDDQLFEDRGLPSDSDAHEYPHANPYREAADV